MGHLLYYSPLCPHSVCLANNYHHPHQSYIGDLPKYRRWVVKASGYKSSKKTDSPCKFSFCFTADFLSSSVRHFQYIYIYIYIYGILKNNWYICMIYSPDNKLIWRGILPYIQSDRLTPHSANQPIGMHHSIVRSST